MSLLATLWAGWACSADEAAPPRAFERAAEATGGMVVSGSAHATEAGLRMLERGGNAVDAAVAAAFALAVAEPSQSGLGGRTQLLVVLRDGTVFGIDGTTEIPSGYDPARAPSGEHGHAAVGVPGTVAALTRAHEEHGALPLSVVMGPARAWARAGVVLPPAEVERIAAVAAEADRAALARFGGVGGEAPRVGVPFRQPELAAVLDAVAAGGSDAFYRGSVADEIARDVARHGGSLAAADLAGYRAFDARVGRVGVAGVELIGTYLPASGVTVTEALRIVDRVAPDPSAGGAWAGAVADALSAAFEDRERSMEQAPAAAVDWLLSDSLADRRAREIDELRRGAARAPPVAALEPEPPHTTHVSVADAFGTVVALTQSLGPSMGARVVTPELGFLYASTMGGYLALEEPGARPWSSQAPVVVVRDGRPAWVLGGAGARRIVSALTLVLARLLHGSAALTEALAAPRLHPTGGEVRLEVGWDLGDELDALGYRWDMRPASYFARLNVIEVRPFGFVGAADPRWPGGAAGGPR